MLSGRLPVGRRRHTERNLSAQQANRRTELMNFAAPPSLDDSYPLCLNFLNVTDELFGISPPKPSDIATFLNWVKTSDVAPSHVVEEIRASAHPDELQALFVEA